LLSRIILASTQKDEWILDPFCGSSTTGIASNLLNRRYLGIEKEEEFLKISKNRRIEIENIDTAIKYRAKIKDLNSLDVDYSSQILNDYSGGMYGDLPF
jgi:site-specific DNA-methyltransferase (adenine-specific)